MPPTVHRPSNRRRPGVRRLGTAAATLALLAPTALAAAEDPGPPADVDHVVTMGAVDPALGSVSAQPGDPSRTDRFEYVAYYPEVLRVHRGDTVWFQRDGFHTFEFGAPDEGVPLFLRNDELPGTVAVRGVDPTDPSCAARDAAPCVIDDPDQPFGSGWSSAKVRIDLPLGVYDYHCAIHENMTGMIEVVPDDQAVPSRAQVDAARRDRVAADTRAGEVVMELGQAPEVEVVAGVRTWKVRAGAFAADGRVAVIRFLPSTLEVAPGDDVEFVVPDSPRGSELHTASFPQDAWPFGFVSYVDPRCDPDAPDGGAFGAPLQYALLATGVGCPDGTTLEFGIHPWAFAQPATAPGNALVTEATVHDTGWLAPGNLTCQSRCSPDGQVEFPSRATTSFPTVGRFTYQCNIHPEWGMVGVVEVVA